MSYTHFRLKERHYIEIELRKGTTQTAIANALERDQSNISREISRNQSQRGYRHKQAHQRAMQRHAEKAKRVKLTPERQTPNPSLS